VPVTQFTFAPGCDHYRVTFYGFTCRGYYYYLPGGSLRIPAGLPLLPWPVTFSGFTTRAAWPLRVELYQFAYPGLYCLPTSCVSLLD
jgi:hypothetical protein